MLRWLALICLAKQCHFVPINNPDYDNENSIIPIYSCQLPKPMDFEGGLLKDLEDCPPGSMKRLTLPIPDLSDYSGYGAVPKICCPLEHGEEPICLPSDPYCQSFDGYDYPLDEYQEALKVQRLGYPKVTEMDTLCTNSSACVQVTRCGKVENPSLNKFCGLDSFVPKVCCAEEDILDVPKKEERPRFPDKTGKARPCDDVSEYCKAWREEGACNLDQHFVVDPAPVLDSQRMFTFMSLTCQSTCGWCGDKGCVDYHPNCQEWARRGSCSTELLFMHHICRESCGTCGFLSPRSEEEQVLEGKSYSDFNADTFDCGRNEDLDNLEKAGVKVNRPLEIQDEINYLITDKKECRKSFDNSDLEEFNFNERSTDDGFFPENAFCGTTIINDRWLVTAAHCRDLVDRADGFQVQTIRQIFPESKEIIQQRKVYGNPYYAFPKTYADIALIELNRRVLFNYTAFGDSPTCLNEDLTLTDKTAIITGIGKNDEENKDVLLETNTTLTEYNSCHQSLLNFIEKDERLKEKYCFAIPYGIQEEHICGIANPYCYLGDINYSGSCKADSGGPVQFKSNGKTTLAGIVSGSLACKSPSAEWFTNVAYYRNWINCIIETSKGHKKSQDEVQEICKKYIKPPSGLLDICKQNQK